MAKVTRAVTPALSFGRTVYDTATGFSHGAAANRRQQALYDQEQERYRRALDQQQADYEKRLAERAQQQARQQFEVDAFEADARSRTAAALTEQRQALDKLTVERAAAERQRRAALRRAVARENAALAGRGIAPASGSGEAILLGLMSDSEAGAREAEQLDRLRLAALSDDVAALRRRNLLELTELTERHRIQRLTWEV